MRKRLLFAAIALIALNGMLTAQAKTSLSVQCNQERAGVYLNESLIGYTSPNFSALVFPGKYSIRVSKEGFSDFRTNIVVGRSPVTIIANLGGSALPGRTPPPQVQPFHPAATSQLTVDSNVPGALVYLNGSFAGETPFVSFLNPGTYSVVIRLEGYEEYSSTVKVNGRNQVHATLVSKSRFVDYEIRIPEYFTVKGKKPAQFNDLEIYLDGKRLQSAFGKTTSGTHRLTLVSRDLRLENNFELAPGKPASIELFLGISVR
jgi:hypothetical protein